MQFLILLIEGMGNNLMRSRDKRRLFHVVIGGRVADFISGRFIELKVCKLIKLTGHTEFYSWFLVHSQ